MILSNNPFLEYHKMVAENPNRFCAEIKQMVGIQKQMLKIFDFLPEKAEKVIQWIEKYCILPEGENAGQKVRLMLWQKWFIYQKKDSP